MTGIIERAAKALTRYDMMTIALEDGIALEPGGLDASVEEKWKLSIPAVRAVLAAIRPEHFGDLPEAMALAGEEAMGREPPSYSGAHRVLAAMIDAALDEQS